MPTALTSKMIEALACFDEMGGKILGNELKSMGLSQGTINALRQRGLIDYSWKEGETTSRYTLNAAGREQLPCPDVQHAVAEDTNPPAADTAIEDTNPPAVDTATRKSAGTKGTPRISGAELAVINQTLERLTANKHVPMDDISDLIRLAGALEIALNTYKSKRASRRKARRDAAKG